MAFSHTLSLYRMRQAKCMETAKKNLLSNTEVLLQKILDKLDDIYTVLEAQTAIQEEAYNLSIGKVTLAQVQKGET